jgi:hypothetical protein
MPYVDFDESEKTPQRTCPNRTGLIMVKGRLTPKTCWGSTCPVCRPCKALAHAGAVFEEGQPDYFFRYRNMPEDLDDRCDLMNDLRRKVSKITAPAGIEQCWTTHVNTDRERPGCHVHVVARFDDAKPWKEQEALEHLQDQVETFDPNPYLAEIVNPLGVAKYMVREFLGDESAAQEALGWNGGRFVHSSRRFIPGGMKEAVDRQRAGAYLSTMPTNGEPLDRVGPIEEFTRLLEEFD